MAMRTLMRILLAFILVFASLSPLYAETASYDIHKEIPLRFHNGGAQSSGIDLSNPWIPLPPLFLVESQGYFKQNDVPMEISIPGKLVVECKSMDVWAGNTVPCRAWIESQDDPSGPELSSNYGFLFGVKFRDVFWKSEFLDIGKDFALQINANGRMPLGNNLLCGIDYVNFASLPIEEFIPGKSAKVEALKELIGSAGLGEFSLAGELVVKGNYVELFIDSSPVRITGFRDAAAYPIPADDPNVEPFALHVPEDLGNSQQFNPETNTVFFEPTVSYNMDLYKTAGLKFSLIGPLEFNFSPSVLDKGKNIMGYRCPDIDTLSYYTKAMNGVSIRSDGYLNLSFPLKDTPFLPDLTLTDVLVNGVPYGKVFADEWTGFGFRIANIGERGTANPSDPEYHAPWFTYTATIDGQAAYNQTGDLLQDCGTDAVVEKNGTHTFGTFVFKFSEGLHTIGFRPSYSEFKTLDQNGQPLYGVGDYNRSNNGGTYSFYVQPRGIVVGRILSNPCVGGLWSCGIGGIDVCLRDVKGGSYYECRTTSSVAGEENGAYRFQNVPTGDYSLEYRPPQPTAEERAAGAPFYAPRSFSFHHEGTDTDDFHYSAYNVSLGSMALYQYQKLKGYIRNSSGGAIPDAQVQMGSAGLGAYGQTVTTDANGMFVFADVPPVGTFTLTATHDNYQPATLTQKMSILDSGWTEVSIRNIDPLLGTDRNYITLAADTTIPTLYVEPIAGGGYGSGSLAFRIRATDTNGKKMGSYRFWLCEGESGNTCGTWSAPIPYPTVPDQTALADITASIDRAVPEGRHRLFIRVEDLAGNPKEAYVTFTKDSIPPDLMTISLKDPATTDTGFTSGKFVDVDLMINNGEAATLAVYLSNDAEEQKTWSAPFYFTCSETPPCTMAIKEWQVTELDQFSGSKTVYAKVVDRAGNSSVIAGGFISVDTTGTVLLADGARYFNSTHVPLKINIAPPPGTLVYGERSMIVYPLGSTTDTQYRAQKIVIPEGSPVTFNAFSLIMDNKGDAANAVVGNPGSLSIKIVGALNDADPEATGAMSYFSWTGDHKAVLNTLIGSSPDRYSGGGLTIYPSQSVTLNPGTYYLLVYATATDAQNYYKLYCDSYNMNPVDKPSYHYVTGTGWQPVPETNMMSGNSYRIAFSFWDNTPGEIRIAANGDCDSLSETDWHAYDYPPTTARSVDFTADNGGGPGLGPQKVCVEYRHANIQQNRTYYDSIVIDTGLPTGTATFQSFDRTSMSAFIDLSATDATTGIEYVRWKMGEIWPYPQPFTPLLKIDNVNTNRIDIQFIDKAGNESAVQTITIPDDVVAPALGLIKINNGSGFTTNPQLTIRLEASDDRALAKIVYREAISGATGELLISGTTHGADYSFAIPTKNINGSDVLLDGIYSYTFHVEDAAGNRSAPLRAAVVLDREVPAISNLRLQSRTGRTVTTEPAIRMTFEAADNLGPMQMRYSFDNATWSTPATVAKGQTVMDITGPSPLPLTYAVHLEIKDGAGNLATAQAQIATNSPPARPTGLFPSGITFGSTPRLSGSAFVDPDSDIWDASWFIIRRASDGSAVVNTGVLARVYDYTIKPADNLLYDVEYNWIVRYRDSFGQWSPVSAPVSFTLRKPVLTVARDGSGSGTVSSAPEGIACSAAAGDCTEAYIPGTAVTLTASPAAGSVFTGWSGPCSGTESCALVMSSDLTVTATFAADSTPPVTTLSGKPANPTNAATAEFSFTANEAATFQCRLDGGAFAACVSPVSYAGLTEGSHTFAVKATDAAGNEEAPPASHTWTVDTVAPVLSLSALSDGAFTNNATLNLTGTVADAGSGVKTLTIDGTAVTLQNGAFSHALTLLAGANGITTTATDNAGNTATDSRTIILDQQLPVLVMTAPADNGKMNQPSVTVAGTVGETATVTMKANSGSAQPLVVTNGLFSAPATLLYGLNTLEVTATDRAGNVSTAKRTVTYDNLGPELAVTQPAQDMATNQASLTLKGSVSDLTGITVTVRMDNNTHTPPVAAGLFEQVLTFGEQKAYQITVTATDEVGNVSTAQRNILYNATAPTLTVSAVTTPTNQTAQTLSGTRDPNGTITVSSPTAAVGAVSYPSGNAWSVHLSGLTEGSNSITVSAADPAGNVSTVTVTLVRDTQAETAVLSGTPPALTNMAGAELTVGGMGVLTYRYRLDDGPYSAETPISAKIQLAALPDGTHTVYAIVRDAAGNWQTEASATTITWTVDTAPPVTTAMPAGGVYGIPQNVTLAASETATIRYTLDGSEPTTASTLYAAGTPIPVNRTATLKFFAQDPAGNREIAKTATYTLAYPLTVSRTGLGEGSVGVDTGLLSWTGLTGTATYDRITPVTLNAIPAPGSSFAGWSGACSGNQLTCTVTMDQSRSATAAFEDATAPVVTIIAPADNGNSNQPSARLEGTVDKAAVVTLTVNGGVVQTLTLMDGRFSVDANLTYGMNTLVVTATNPAGNTGTASRTIRYIKSGDIDGDGSLTLADAILAMQIMAGLPTEGRDLKLSADVNGDGAIGFAEVLYILQKVSLLRP